MWQRIINGYVKIISIIYMNRWNINVQLSITPQTIEKTSYRRRLASNLPPSGIITCSTFLFPVLFPLLLSLYFVSLILHWLFKYTCITIRFAYEHIVEFKWFWYSKYFIRTPKHFYLAQQDVISRIIRIFIFVH